MAALGTCWPSGHREVPPHCRPRQPPAGRAGVKEGRVPGGLHPGVQHLCEVGPVDGHVYNYFKMYFGGAWGGLVS